MASPRRALPVLLLPEEHAAALDAACEDFSPRTQQRGGRYATEGRVRQIRVDGDDIVAIVAGSDRYETRWLFDPDEFEWWSHCSCPVGTSCKHAYAVARRILDTDPRRHRRGRGETVQNALEMLRSDADRWRRVTGLRMLCTRSGALELPRDHELVLDPDPDLRCWRVARAIAGRAGAELVPELEPYLDRPDLEKRYTDRERGRLVADLMSLARAKKKPADRRLRVEIGTDRNPAGDARLYVLARLTTPRLRDVPRSRKQLERLWVDVMDDGESLAPAERALLGWLVERHLGATDDYRRAEETAEVPELLRRFGDSGLVTWAAEQAPDIAAAAGIVAGARVEIDPEVAEIRPSCRARDGSPWIHLEIAWSDGRTRPFQGVVHAKGSSLHGPRGQGVLLLDGRVTQVASTPPENLMEQFAVTGGFVVPVGGDTPLPALAASFPGIAAGVAEHTRTVPCTPIVALDLREDDWLQLRVYARPVDVEWRPGDAPPARNGPFELTPEGRWVQATTDASSATRDAWSILDEAAADGDAASAPLDARASTASAAQAISSPEPAADDAAPARGAEPDTAAKAPAPERAGPFWFDHPARVEAVESWLAELDVRPGTVAGPGGVQPTWEDRARGWWMRLSPKRMARFGPLWDRRPPDATYFGNGRALRLFGRGHRAMPKLRVESSGIDWFGVRAEWQDESNALTESDLTTLRSSTTRFVKLSSGWVQRASVDEQDGTTRLLAELGVEPGGGEEKITVWQLAGVAPGTLDALETEGADTETVEAVRTLRKRVQEFRGLPRVRKPAGLRATLRPYQQDGVDFLSYGASLGLGTVLADDMGLGKTLQALAWLATSIRTSRADGPSLVVCPTSVQSVWAREAARFLPSLDVVVLGRGSARHAEWEHVPKRDLVITNYALLRRDAERWKEIPLRALILDEAQNIKNPDAASTRAARSLQAKHRIALTGTPLENRTLDLWSILSIVSPGYLGSRSAFREQFDRADLPPHRRALLSARLRPLMLRRLKSDVAPDLPDRIEEVLECDLTDGQRKLYLAEVRRSRELVASLRRSDARLKKNRIAVLAALTRLRQICCHPALCGGRAELGSGKLAVLFDLLEPLLAEGHKVLVFSQFVEYLKIVAGELERREMPHFMLTGATRDRQRLIDDFSRDPRASVFLLSLKAGGTGLNLTAASYVVLLDPWWNPAVEAQAIDRTHRIGQDRTVIAYRLVATGTIEEKIRALQEQKSKLVRDVLGEETLAARLTPDDLAFLLGPDAA